MKTIAIGCERCGAVTRSLLGLCQECLALERGTVPRRRTRERRRGR